MKMLAELLVGPFSGFSLTLENIGGRYRIRTYDFHRVNESSGEEQWICE